MWVDFIITQGECADWHGISTRANIFYSSPINQEIKRERYYILTYSCIGSSLHRVSITFIRKCVDSSFFVSSPRQI